MVKSKKVKTNKPGRDLTFFNHDTSMVVPVFSPPLGQLDDVAENAGQRTRPHWAAWDLARPDIERAQAAAREAVESGRYKKWRLVGLAYYRCSHLNTFMAEDMIVDEK